MWDVRSETKMQKKQGIVDLDRRSDKYKNGKRINWISMRVTYQMCGAWSEKVEEEDEPQVVSCNRKCVWERKGNRKGVRSIYI
jgi:hypothetical protein